MQRPAHAFIPQKCKYTVIRLPHLQIDLCGSVVIHNSDRLRLRAEIAQHIRFAQWKSYACCRKRSAFGECFSGDIARWCADPDKLAARCGEAPQKLQCRCADTGTAADHDPSVAHLPNAERSGLRGIDCGMCGQNALVAIVKVGLRLHQPMEQLPELPFQPFHGRFGGVQTIYPAGMDLVPEAFDRM